MGVIDDRGTALDAIDAQDIASNVYDVKTPNVAQYMPRTLHWSH